jgi:signal-transduction protein with cAMP-binding, CBS, and nucleotidyltransferase domain
MMRQRFEGKNRPQLIAALKRQEFACGNTEIAEALAMHGELAEFQPGENIIVQSGTDNDVYFLIVGVVGIVVNGAQIAPGRLESMSAKWQRSSRHCLDQQQCWCWNLFLRLRSAARDLWR